MYEHASDYELIKAIARKDTAAFTAFMNRYQDRVFRTVYRFVGDAENTRDLVQDIFLKVYRSAHSYKPNAELFTWLYRIIANHCINFSVKQKKDPLFRAEDQSQQSVSSAAPLIHADSPEKNFIRQERSRRVRQALNTLPERQKLAITLLRFDGLSYREISEILGCSVSAVESLIFRGMETLKTLLAENQIPKP